MKNTTGKGDWRKGALLFNALFALLLAFVLSFVIYIILNGAVASVHTVLSEIFPKSISLKNPIEHPSDYRKQELIYAGVSAVLTILISSFVPSVVSKKKSKFFFNLTSGLVSLKEGREIYIRTYLLSDILASAILAGIFTVVGALLPLSVLPSDVGVTSNSPIQLLGYPFLPFIALNDAFGLPIGILISITVALLGTLVSIPMSVRAYRAAALVHSIE